MRTYAFLPSPYWIIRDGDDDRITRLKFHITEGDYFPFLATIIGMLGDTVARCEGAEEGSLQIEFVEAVKKDLLYLHENYDITTRKERLAFTREKVMRFGDKYERS